MGRGPASLCALAVVLVLAAGAWALPSVPIGAEPAPQPYAANYTNVYGRIICYADALVRPTSTAELAAAVRQLRAGAAAAGKPLKLRVSRPVFHGTPTFGCPDAFGPGRGSPVPFTRPAPPSASAAAPSTAAVMIDRLDAVVAVDRARNLVTVQTGLRIDKLLKWAEANGFSMERGAPSTYAELSIGGVIATGGHGMGHNVSSNMADATESFTWVDSSGEVHTSSRDSPEGRALSGGLGLIGIITEVTLRMTPPSLTKAVSRTFLTDANMVADIEGYLKESPWTAIIWRPDLHKYSAFTLHPATGEDMGAAITLIPRVPRAFTAAIELFYFPWQSDYKDALASKLLLNPLNCLTQAVTVVIQTWASIGIVPVPVGVGSTNKVVGGGCEGGCAWDGGLAVDDIALAIERADLPAWIEDVRKITKLDLQEGGAAPERCMATGHYLLRFGKASNDYIAPFGGMRDPVMVELSLLRDRKLPEVQAKFAWVQDAVEQLTLCKYKGRPHFGKNFDRTYAHPDCPLRDNLPEFGRLLELRGRYDPDRVLEPPLAALVEARAPAPRFPGCALSKQCYCSEDVHCGRDHYCAASKAFPQYRACRPVGQATHG